VPLAPKDRNDRLDEWSDGTVKPIEHISIHVDSRYITLIGNFKL